MGDFLCINSNFITSVMIQEQKIVTYLARVVTLHPMKENRSIKYLKAKHGKVIQYTKLHLMISKFVQSFVKRSFLWMF